MSYPGGLPPDEVQRRIRGINRQDAGNYVDGQITRMFWGTTGGPSGPASQLQPAQQQVSQPVQNPAQQPAQQVVTSQHQQHQQQPLQPIQQQALVQTRHPHAQSISQSQQQQGVQVNPQGQLQQRRVEQLRRQHQRRQQSHRAAQIAQGVPSLAGSQNGQHFVHPPAFQYQQLPAQFTQSTMAPQMVPTDHRHQLFTPQNVSQMPPSPQFSGPPPPQAFVSPVYQQAASASQVYTPDNFNLLNPNARPAFSHPVAVPAGTPPQFFQQPQMLMRQDPAVLFQSRLRQYVENPFVQDLPYYMVLEWRAAVGDPPLDPNEYIAYDNRRRFYFETFIRFISDHDSIASWDHNLLAFLLVAMRGHNTFEPPFVHNAFFQAYEYFRRHGTDHKEVRRIYAFMRELRSMWFIDETMMMQYGPPPPGYVPQPIMNPVPMPIPLLQPSPQPLPQPLPEPTPQPTPQPTPRPRPIPQSPPHPPHQHRPRSPPPPPPQPQSVPAPQPPRRPSPEPMPTPVPEPEPHVSPPAPPAPAPDTIPEGDAPQSAEQDAIDAALLSFNNLNKRMGLTFDFDPDADADADFDISEFINFPETDPNETSWFDPPTLSGDNGNEN